MNISLFFFASPNIDWFETLKFIASNVLLPILIACLTYFFVDKLGDYKKRRTYSRLGIAIIESLQEEIRYGIKIMTEALEITNFEQGSPPVSLLPKKSWNGMSTIPDEVLLRIIETSKDLKFDGFPPRDCRIHCKNYFEYMNYNYEQAINSSRQLAINKKEWRTPIRILLADDTSKYIQATNKVEQMLENAKKLLELNTKAVFPK